MPLLFTQLELAAQLQRARETQLVNGCQIFIDVHSSGGYFVLFPKRAIPCYSACYSACYSKTEIFVCLKNLFDFCVGEWNGREGVQGADL